MQTTTATKKKCRRCRGTGSIALNGSGELATCPACQAVARGDVGPAKEPPAWAQQQPWAARDPHEELNFIVERAVDAVLGLRADLVRALQDRARQAEQDAQRVLAGGKPWYSAGQYARDGADTDLTTARYQAAVDHLSTLRYLARRSAPTSLAGCADAAVGLAEALWRCGSH